MTVEKRQSGWDNRKGAWWKNEEGVKIYSIEAACDPETKQVYAKFDNKAVPILGFRGEELAQALEQLNPKYKPTSASEQTKRDIVCEGIFTTC